MISGRPNGGAFGSSVCWSSVTAKPAERTVSSVGRLQSQHTTNRLSGFIRSCIFAVCGSIDAAEHERRDNRVEARVLERKILGRGREDRCVRVLLAGLT